MCDKFSGVGIDDESRMSSLKARNESEIVVDDPSSKR